MTKVLLLHVNANRGVCAARVETDQGTTHHVGHLPFSGWHCTQHGRRCAQVRHVKALVPVEAIEQGAQLVESGAAPPEPQIASSEPFVRPEDWTDEEWLRLMRELSPAEMVTRAGQLVAEWRTGEGADHGSR